MIKIPCAYQVVSVLLVFSFSFASLAADGPSVPAAMLQATGSVRVNGNGVLSSTAVFLGDSVQTQNDSLADITAEGTSVLVMPNSSVKFQGKTVEVDQGEVVVATSKGVSTIADELTITPAAQKQSKYEVSQDEEFVTIAAQQGDVTVNDGQASSTVPEGQQTTQKKKRKKRGAGAEPAATGGFPTRTVAIVAVAGGAAAAGILIATSSSKKRCVSSSNNKKCKCTTNKNGTEDCFLE